MKEIKFNVYNIQKCFLNSFELNNNFLHNGLVYLYKEADLLVFGGSGPSFTLAYFMSKCLMSM